MSEETLSIVITTVPTREAAETVATALLEKRLAACVNIIPGVVSRYWWEGKLESQDELLLVIKSPAALARELEEALKSAHPYDTPEIVALTPSGVAEEYRRWVLAECGRHNA